MAQFSIESINISGIVATVPKNEVDNSDYDWISEEDRKLLISSTGIRKRRVAPLELAVGDMAHNACEELISGLHWNKEDIGIIILVSQSADYVLPATSIILQEKLGLNKSTIAFDINLGCSGYVYGLSTIMSLMKSANIKKGILVAGDRSTPSTYYKDKSSHPLFGDAVTATGIELGEFDSLCSFDLNSDGSGEEAIKIKAGGGRFPYEDKYVELEEVGEQIIRTQSHLALNGHDVFRYALKYVPKAIKDFSENIGFSLEKPDYYVLHQANKLINKSIQKKLKVSKEKFPETLSEYGNTSSASIPLTIASKLHEYCNQEGNTLLLSGFGVGFSWASMYLKQKSPIFTKLTEL